MLGMIGTKSSRSKLANGCFYTSDALMLVFFKKIGMLTIKQRLDQHFIPTHFEEILLSFFYYFFQERARYQSRF